MRKLLKNESENLKNKNGKHSCNIDCLLAYKGMAVVLLAYQGTRWRCWW